MKKVNTVKKHSEFDSIVRGGDKIRTPHFSFFYQKSELDHIRIGLSVGKKNGNAVTRVRIKRQVRAMLDRRKESCLPINLIIAIRPEFVEADKVALEKELNDSLDRIKEQLN